jgi:hypothetical protein
MPVLEELVTVDVASAPCQLLVTSIVGRDPPDSDVVRSFAAVSTSQR